jgi:hypothetical protein
MAGPGEDIGRGTQEQVRTYRTRDGIDRLQAAKVVSFLKGANNLVRKVSAFTHNAQFAARSGFDPRPEWFDHYLDQNWQFSAKTTLVG